MRQRKQAPAGCKALSGKPALTRYYWRRDVWPNYYLSDLTLQKGARMRKHDVPSLAWCDIIYRGGHVRKWRVVPICHKSSPQSQTNKQSNSPS